MKRISIILLICIYALATMGYGVNQFYCCGQLQSSSVSLISHSQQKCLKGDGAKGCCDNKIQFYKVKDNHVASDHVDSPVKQFEVLNTFHLSSNIISVVAKKSSVTNQCNAPPPKRDVPLYLYNCVFTV